MIPDESTSTEQKLYKDNHLYIDIEFSSHHDIEISIKSILHKVLITDTWESYQDTRQCNFENYKNVFYSQYSFTFENFTKFNQSPFEQITATDFKKQIKEMSMRSAEAYHAKYNQEEKESDHGRDGSKKRVRGYLDHYVNAYQAGDDDVECMDPKIPFDRDEFDENKMKLPLQRGRRLVVDEIDIQMDRAISFHSNNSNNFDIHRNDRIYNRIPASNINVRQPKTKRKKPVLAKDILAKNKREIGNDQQKEMRKICNNLGLSKGMHIGVTIYGYGTHLECYKDIVKCVKIEGVMQRNNYVQNMNTNKLRDIKSKIGSEGKTGKKQEMVAGIVKMLPRLQENYKRNTRNNNNNNNDNRRYSGNTSNSENVPILFHRNGDRKRNRNNNHNNFNKMKNRKKRRRNNDLDDGDRLKQKRRYNLNNNNNNNNNSNNYNYNNNRNVNYPQIKEDNNKRLHNNNNKINNYHSNSKTKIKKLW